MYVLSQEHVFKSLVQREGMDTYRFNNEYR